jgi:murein L,D-transpeptidase YcbB/YkuD
MIKSITDLQTEIGVKPDGVWGPVSSQALSEALKSRIIKITENGWLFLGCVRRQSGIF